MSSGRFFQTIHGTKFREFGILASVHTDSWGVTIVNEDGHSVGMRNIYQRWANVAQKAQSLVGSSVVIETGGSSSSTDYFRDIYSNSWPIFADVALDDPNQGLVGQVILARTGREENQYQAAMWKERYGQLREQLQELTAAEKKESEVASASLDDVWDSWQEDPDKTFLIVGAAYGHKPLPTKLDKSFAIRMGINTMKRKRIAVKVVERTYKNNVLVELPQFDDVRCQVALVMGNQEDTKNEWCIKTVTNTLRGFEKLEEQLYPGWKNSRKEVGYYLDAHQDILTHLFTAVA